MDLRNLFEDVDADTQASALADEFFVRLYAHIHGIVERNGYMDIAEIEGEDCLAVGGHSVSGCPEEFADTMVIFKDHSGYRGGSALKLDKEENNGYSSAVVMRIPAANPKIILGAMGADKVHNALLHELVHVLDFQRYKSSDDMRRPPEDPVAYHNDSLELNAFFHNLAEPLLNRLRFVHKEGPEALDLFDPLESNFKDWLAKRVKIIGDPVLKRHWASLTEPNRRRAISRLKALYDRLIDISKTVDERA